MSSTHHSSKAGRYFFRFSLGVLSVLLLAWLWQKYYDSRILPIRHVKIMGNFFPVSQSMLQNSILPFVQKGFLQLDKIALQTHLLKHTWIATATVHRVWPDTLMIRLNTRTPLARIRLIDNPSAVKLLDNEAHIFESETGWIDPELPLLIGSASQAKYLLSIFQQLKTLLDPLACTIDYLALDVGQRLQLRLANGTQLLLGHLDPVAQLRHLLAIYPKILQDQKDKPLSIDLRYPNKMAVLTRETSI